MLIWQCRRSRQIPSDRAERWIEGSGRQLTVDPPKVILGAALTPSNPLPFLPISLMRLPAGRGQAR